MGVDRRMWKMSPERLQEHLQLKNRARQIPDKKKQNNKRACREVSRRASRIFRGLAEISGIESPGKDYRWTYCGRVPDWGTKLDVRLWIWSPGLV